MKQLPLLWPILVLTNLLSQVLMMPLLQSLIQLELKVGVVTLVVLLMKLEVHVQLTQPDMFIWQVIQVQQMVLHTMVQVFIKNQDKLLLEWIYF